jgi:hypothetical protein
MASPYLELPFRSLEEVLRMRAARQKFADSMLSSTCKARVVGNPNFPA